MISIVMSNLTTNSNPENPNKPDSNELAKGNADRDLVKVATSHVVDVAWIIEYGLTQKLSNSVRVF